MSITHNKIELFYQIYLIIVYQLLPIKDEYTFRFSNFLMIGLCSSSTNSLFSMEYLSFYQKFVNH